jgi:hypothetical protein
MKSKKGYAYFVELALAIIIIFIVLSSYIESEQTIYNYKQNENSRQNSWQILKNLDEFYIIDSANFSKVNTYVDASLDYFTSFDLEYYNTSGCFPVDNGVLGSNYTKCETINASIKNNIISSFYTRSTSGVSESVRIYIWRKI